MILVSPRTRRGVGPSALSSVGNFFSPGWSHNLPVSPLPQEMILLNITSISEALVLVESRFRGRISR